MKLFKKKTGKAANGGNDKLAGIIAKAILRMQSVWAGWMQRQSDRLSHKNKKAVLIICCLLTAGYSAVVIIEGVRGDSRIDLKISSIHKPVMINDDPVPRLDTPGLRRIQHFQHYIDSLRKDSSGKAALDSINKARPGLLDSLHYVENIYQLQLKK